MSTIKTTIKEALPAGLVRRRDEWRRAREHRRTYGPAAPIDLQPLRLLREADRARLEDPEALELLLPRLGLNDEHLEEFPALLHPDAGKGLRHWQYPSQFAPYLVELGRHDVRSYLEIGTRHGGTFAITVEYLRRFGTLDWAIGLDLQRAPGVEAFAAQTPGVEALAMSSRDGRFRALVRERRPDLVLIDGDHTEDGVRADLSDVADVARLIAFHDIASDVVPGVGAVWRELRETAGDRFAFHEFTAQYPDVLARGAGSVLGLGLAIRR